MLYQRNQTRTGQEHQGTALLLSNVLLQQGQQTIDHNLSVFHKLHVEATIDRAKLQHVKQLSSNSTSSSIIVYRTLQPEYRYAE